MGNDFFNEYPYTDFHELNLSWVIKQLRTFATTLEQFVSINALKYADPIQWDITKQYEKNTIVIDPLSGTAYISVAPVPVGVALTNPDYWTVVFNLEQFVTKANGNFTFNVEEQSTTTATFNTPENGWVVWGGDLYKANTNIIAGDQYVVDSNISRICVEMITGHLEDLTTTAKDNLVEAINETLQTISDIVGDLSDLATTDKSSVVDAINEVIQTFSDIIGSLSDLTTTDKTSIVNSINEVLQTLSSVAGDLSDLNTSDKTSLVNAINEVIQTYADIIGELSDLNTTDKSSVVNAINEVNSTGGGALAKIGDLDSLLTTDKSNLVSAINEVKTDLDNVSVFINPDDFPGDNDSEKIQACYDYAVSITMDVALSRPVTIVIDRVYDLSVGGTIQLKNSSANAIHGHGSMITFMGLNNGCLMMDVNNSDYMFEKGQTDDVYTHNHRFVNLKFYGTDLILNENALPTNDEANYSHARVFDTAFMANLFISNCQFMGFTCVFDNRNAVTTGLITMVCTDTKFGLNMEIMRGGCRENAIVFKGCAIESGMVAFNLQTADTSSSTNFSIVDCVCEYWGNFFMTSSNRTMYSLVCRDCYFEGVKGVIFSLYGKCQAFTVTGCSLMCAGVNSSVNSRAIDFKFADDSKLVLHGCYFENHGSSAYPLIASSGGPTGSYVNVYSGCVFIDKSTHGLIGSNIAPYMKEIDALI